MKEGEERGRENGLETHSSDVASLVTEIDKKIMRREGEDQSSERRRLSSSTRAWRLTSTAKDPPNCHRNQHDRDFPSSRRQA